MDASGGEAAWSISILRRASNYPVDSPSNDHSSTSTRHEAKAKSNRGLRLYSAKRFRSALSCSLASSTILGLCRLRAGRLDRPNERGPPGDGSGVAAGVTANGVGAERLGQGKPPDVNHLLRTKEETAALTLYNQLAQVACRRPGVARGDDAGVDADRGVCPLFGQILGGVEPGSVRRFPITCR